jgi:hypothetical protein
MENDKYHVFKSQDVVFHADLGQYIINATRPDGESTPLQDAYVIRTQDIFAGPGLSAYAMVIQTAIDLRLGNALNREHLKELRDLFVEASVQAFQSPLKKIPD